VVAATSRDLEQDVQRRLRRDLFYRLNVIPIYRPAGTTAGHSPMAPPFF
jgi:transcriptional regulator with GAF, ATPase, and Fis domain